MKLFFKTVMNLLKNIPNLYIAENWGQLDLAQPPLTFPCVLVDLEQVNYIQQGCLRQEGEGDLILTIADRMYGGLENITPEILQEREFILLDKIDAIHAILHGKAGGEMFSNLIRVKIQKQSRQDSIRAFIITYKFSYVDIISSIQYTHTKLSPLLSN
ncbi:MAG: hypothetical protein RR393_08265 [Bacteroidales bacterium]